MRPDILHTSVQLRAIRTAELALDECERKWIPVRRSWRLNERHYGDLQGKDKRETTAQFGADKVKVWRRSYDVPPPDLDPTLQRNAKRWGYDERYAALPRDVLPRAECLKDVLERMLPWWYDAIVPDLRTGATVMVAAHGNSLARPGEASRRDDRRGGRRAESPDRRAARIRAERRPAARSGARARAA